MLSPKNYWSPNGTPGEMSDGGRDFDGAQTVFDRVRRLAALGMFDPGLVTAETLVDELESVGGRYRRSLADAIEAYAREDPAGMAPHRDRLLAVLDEYAVEAGDPVARTVGRLASVDPDVVDALADRLGGFERGVAAAKGLAVAVDSTPERVARRTPDLVAALGESDRVLEPLARVLAELYVVDADGPEGPVRPRVGRLIDDEDARLRAGGVRTVCLAAARGCQPAIDELPRVVDNLTEGSGGFFASDRPDLDREVLAGLREVADEQPHFLVPHVDTLLAFPDLEGDDDAEDDLRGVLTAVAAASRPVYEALLDEVAPSDDWLSSVRSLRDTVTDSVGVTDSIEGAPVDERARGALVGGAPANVDVLVRREETVRAILDEDPVLGATLVRAVARERPADAEWAIDPLLGHLDAAPGGDAGTEAAAETIAVLARTYPMVAGTVVDRLAGRTGDDAAGAVVAARHLAEDTPAALDGTSGPDGTPVAELLVAELSADAESRAIEAANALTALGIRYPEVLEPVAGDVADALRAASYANVSGRHRAINVLGSVTVHAAPEEMHNVGLTVFDQIRRGEVLEEFAPDEDANGVVPLLGALCSQFERYADQVVDWYDRLDEDDPVRHTLMSVFAEGTWPAGTAFAAHLSTFAAATQDIDDDERTLAVRALAGAVGDAADPPSTASARLVDLLYDTAPGVRRWAAFGVGEWLAASGRSHAEPVKRLEQVAGADAGTPVATLALVRAGERRAGDEVDDLARAGRGDDRGIALAAVEELGGVAGGSTAATDGGEREAREVDPDGNGETGEEGDDGNGEGSREGGTDGNGAGTRGPGDPRRERAGPNGTPDPDARAAAVDALEGIREDHDDPWVRAAAARALEE